MDNTKSLGQPIKDSPEIRLGLLKPYGGSSRV